MNTNIYWIVGIIAVAVITLLLIMSGKANTAVEDTPMLVSPTNTVATGTDEKQTVGVMPINHAAAVLSWGDKTIYTDPTGSSTNYSGSKAANIILITDIHGDHFSTSTLNDLGGTATLIVPQVVMDELPGNLASRAKVLRNGQTITEQGFEITGVPMYNIPEATSSRHTKGRGNGYVIVKDNYKVYIAGDTDNTAEMRALTDIDMAFIPMNPPFTMSVESAADAVLAFKPRVVYPYHYRGQDGLSDIAKFKELVDAGKQNIEVVLLNWYK